MSEFNRLKIWTLGELAQIVGGALDGPEDFEIEALATSASTNAKGLAFAESEKYLVQAEASAVGAVIIPLTAEGFKKPAIRHQNPRQAFGQLLHLFQPQLDEFTGIHPTAQIHPSAQIHPTASIGEFVVIRSNVVIEEGVKIFPFSYIGERCRIGSQSMVWPHAVLLLNVTVGSQCVVGPGAVLGFSGFGYYWDGTRQVTIPQVGGVELEDEVEIGALVAMDRATADSTRVGKGTKFDNLCQIGHNVVIGQHGVFASQVGVSGSTTIGDRHVSGGQSGYADHLTVADGVSLAGRTAVLQDLEEPGVYGGYPAIPFSVFRRNVIAHKDLSELVKTVRKLEKQVQELESRLEKE